MRLTEFVAQRIAEDEVLARAAEPRDLVRLHVCRLGRSLISICERQGGHLSVRQHAVLLHIADLHQGHGDYDPRWWSGIPAGSSPDDW